MSSTSSSSTSSMAHDASQESVLAAFQTDPDGGWTTKYKRVPRKKTLSWNFMIPNGTDEALPQNGSSLGRKLDSSGLVRKRPFGTNHQEVRMSINQPTLAFLHLCLNPNLSSPCIKQASTRLPHALRQALQWTGGQPLLQMVPPQSIRSQPITAAVAAIQDFLLARLEFLRQVTFKEESQARVMGGNKLGAGPAQTQSVFNGDGI
ncbi:hypothetical protein PT974_11906 [Cladobotryum mycophilum]|uniref:Uncharacterized protein n=1 Tax=Cladobotryum mycophilum TaxID=491253 RepID=A0ABR0S6H9_9HYPO